MDTKNAIRELTTYHIKAEPQKNNIKLGISWLFEPTINFYRKTWHLDWLLPVDRNGPELSDDYYYVFQADTDKIKLNSAKILFSSERAKTLLIENK